MATPSADNGDRIPLTRQRILDVAVAFADTNGVDALSMRKLAAELGYEVMSLYNHVHNKNDLLEAMVDEVYGEIAIPRGPDWKAALRQLAIDAHDMLLRHRWAADLLPRQFPGQRRFELSEEILRLLVEGGFEGDLHDLGFHAITLHIAGFTQQQVSYASLSDQNQDLMDRFHTEMGSGQFPLMADHARYHVERGVDTDRPDEFEFVLDLILDGLERRLGT